MRRLIAIFAAIVCTSASPGQGQEACNVPSYLLFSDNALNRVAEAVKKDRNLSVVVLGTGSSMLTGAEGAASAYPARLQAALKQRLPEVAINVVSQAKSGQTTADMAKNLEKIVADLKPNLLIWQAGTVDAIRGVEPEEFRLALDRGVEFLHAKGTDVILVNMQYSPRTESLIALSTYADNMRVVARENDVPLFDRFAIMHYWNDTGVFDLYRGNKASKTAQRVHDCIGRALAAMVIETAHLNDAEDIELRSPR